MPLTHRCRGRESPPRPSCRCHGRGARRPSGRPRRRRRRVPARPRRPAAGPGDAALTAGTAIAEPDSGPGGIYARLADLGREPVRFREEVRSRMPTPEEADRLGLTAGTPVVLVCRTAYTADGHAVEVNEMTLDASAYVLEYEFDAR
ncbi:UTRA domain-containing protein [Streptomyces roseus]|uniref:UTRA domain-containing protein n=1 Tax=Streptomyces roseus TaxID=66430 RepID=UPI0036CA5031